jgi:hypothetical protein
MPEVMSSCHLYGGGLTSASASAQVLCACDYMPLLVQAELSYYYYIS